MTVNEEASPGDRETVPEAKTAPAEPPGVVEDPATIIRQRRDLRDELAHCPCAVWLAVYPFSELRYSLVLGAGSSVCNRKFVNSVADRVVVVNGSPTALAISEIPTLGLLLRASGRHLTRLRGRILLTCNFILNRSFRCLPFYQSETHAIDRDFANR